jgi:hypothetical protein
VRRIRTVAHNAVARLQSSIPSSSPFQSQLNLSRSASIIHCSVALASQSMARRRAEKGSSTASVPLKQPDRAARDPTKETLLEIARQRGLLKDDISQKSGDVSTSDDYNGAEAIGRLGEAVLWSISITMLHLTFDVLVQHQYAQQISWGEIISRSLQASCGQCSYMRSRRPQAKYSL